MADNQRWSVTYTRRVKQKRKVYQDGFLELHSTGRKVMLYDESDKLLVSRLLKKDDAIKSGETLAFECFLVDIGDMRTASRDGKGLTKDCISPNRKPVFRKPGFRLARLSPSQKMIRDFKKAEIEKLVSSPSCINVRSGVTEWQVLYTSQVTQKAKKFHDGFLKLKLSGSEGRQVFLYDANRTHLASRFLKRDETISLGGSLALDGHLVEIEAFHVDDCKMVPNSTPRIENQKPIGEEGSTTKCTALNLESNSSSVVSASEVSLRTPTSEHQRAVRDILSTLRRPIQSSVGGLNFQISESPVNAEECCLGSKKECEIIEVEKTKACEEGKELDPDCLSSSQSSGLSRSKQKDDSDKTPERLSAGIMTHENAGGGEATTLSSSGPAEPQPCEEKESNSPLHEAEASSSIFAASNNCCTLKNQSPVEENLNDTRLLAQETDEFPSFDLGF